MAESGDIDAQSLLGWEYYQPRYDTKPDVQEAIKWFELAAKQGDREAPLALGGIYYDGEQVRVAISASRSSSKTSAINRDNVRFVHVRCGMNA
jgi:TPR repeat protein